MKNSMEEYFFGCIISEVLILYFSWEETLTTLCIMSSHVFNESFKGQGYSSYSMPIFARDSKAKLTSNLVHITKLTPLIQRQIGKNIVKNIN